MAPCSRSGTACSRPGHAAASISCRPSSRRRSAAKYLRALEEERFEQLPSQTYVKGFLRTYADYLGLDGQLYVDEYNSRFVAGDEVDSGRAARRSGPQRRTRRLETAIVLVALAVVAVVTLVVVSAWQTSGSGRRRRRRLRGRTSPRSTRSSQLSAYLQINAVQGPVVRARPSRRRRAASCSSRARSARAGVEPFTGKRFWVQISSPENLIVIVGGKAVPLAGGKPRVLTVTPSGVRTG